jgi:tryptophan-rich sensory protein
MTVTRPQSALTLVGWVALCLAAGGLGSLVTTPKIPTWYASLAKPSWNPPNWVFGPVWTMLYVLMGIAAWLVWSAWAQRATYAAGTYARTGLWWFGVQLVLNVAWSFLFFQWERPDAAFADVLLLWIAIVATIVSFHRAKWFAAWLLIPYLVWVTLAVCLNFAIWRLNA